MCICLSPADGSTGTGSSTVADLLDEGGSSKSKSYDFTTARLTVDDKVNTLYTVMFTYMYMYNNIILLFCELLIKLFTRVHQKHRSQPREQQQQQRVAATQHLRKQYPCLPCTNTKARRSTSGLPTMLVNVFMVRLWCFYDMCCIISSFSGVQLAGSNQTRAIFERLHREAGRRHAAAQHRHDQNEGTRT